MDQARHRQRTGAAAQVVSPLVLRDRRRRPQPVRHERQRAVAATCRRLRRCAGDPQVFVIVRATPLVHHAARGIVAHAAATRGMFLPQVVHAVFHLQHRATAGLRHLPEQRRDLLLLPRLERGTLRCVTEPHRGHRVAEAVRARRVGSCRHGIECAFEQRQRGDRQLARSQDDVEFVEQLLGGICQRQ